MNTPPLILALLAAFVGTIASAADLKLTSNGKPEAVVVLGAGVPTKNGAARTLISHVKEMTGATLPLVAESELNEVRIQDGRILPGAGKVAAETFILLGESALTKKLGLSFDGIGVGGIVVKTTANALVLMGRTEGADGSRSDADFSAVVHFLESLGCRHLWPGPGGTIIPQKSTLAVTDIDIRFTPKVGQRAIRMMARGERNFEVGLAWLGFNEDDYKEAITKTQGTDSLGAWGSWNGLGGSIGIHAGHSGGGLSGGWKEHGKTHPEWFALQVDGTRDQTNAKERWRICESNPELREYVANELIKQLAGTSRPPISLSPNDGGFSSFCQCPNCKALDAPDAPKIKLMIFDKVGEGKRTEIDYPSLTDRHVNYWNDIAARVTKVVPDQLFVIDAYSVYSDAPVREKLHPNLIVRYVPSTTEAWDGWKAAGAKRIYWRPNNLHSGGRLAIVSPKARETARIVNTLTDGGMLATDMQGIYNNWATQGLDYYTAARVTWNPSLSFEGVLDDYCRSGFGAGAEQVKKYWLLADSGIALRPGMFPLIKPETLDAMRTTLITAAKATANDPTANNRVSFLRAGLEFTAISAEAQRLKEVAEATGTKPDTVKVSEVMERRWQLMRAIFQTHPLAVNVALVAANDAPLNAALGWKGPSALAKSTKLQLTADDNWLNEDQSATRK